MPCSSCGSANPAQARFCLGCGRALRHGVVCHRCHTLLPAQARYCFHCGDMVIENATAVDATTPRQIVTAPSIRQPEPAPPVAPPVQPATQRPSPTTATTHPTIPTAVTNLNQLPPPRPLADMFPSLKKYLTQSLLEPLERRPSDHHLAEARDHLASLLRVVKTYLPYPVIMAPQPAGEPAGGMFRGTFLFVDVSGFTPLSERLSRFGRAGAEQVTTIINNLFFDMVTILFDHGGTLLKFGGDALLGLFPADTDEALAAGPIKATQAALAMQSAMSRFTAIEAAGETSALLIKCGISSGPFFAAHIGTTTNMAYVTTGHTVNRAEQAEGKATPGEVIITQSSLDLANGRIEVEPRAEGFYLVHHVVPAEGSQKLTLLEEPPGGAVEAQLTYLVDRLDRLTPYLAAELLPRMATNPGNVQMPPDHRPVTVMFANYVGISDLIEDMGQTRPEIITQQLNNYFVHMAEVVERYEGALGRMDQYSVGDRLVIFFGAPRAHEDDPVRAVYTALDMQKATRQHFAALQTPEGIYRFRQRIGINTGHLFAGNVGATDLRQEYTLMGDDINMAARLMSQAGWGDIFISKRTQQRVAPYFNLKDEGELKVKGKEILIPTFKVLDRRQEIGRTRGLDSGESRLVDRIDELQGLKSCGQALLNGRGQVLSVIGNSGLGKSRLSREFKRWINQQEKAGNLCWLEGQCFSFSEQVSYWLAIQLFYCALGLKAGDNPDDVLYALWEKGEELLGKEIAREAIPFLANLLDLKLEGEWARWVEELDPKVRQKQTFWAAREFFMALARHHPLVITLDDLHWADEASLALVEDLLTISDRTPILFYLIFREQRNKGCWRLRDKADSAFAHRYTQIELKPLSDIDSQELLANLLPGAEISESSEREILDKAAGNPFYLEEVVRSLIAGGGVVPDKAREGHWQVTGKIDQITIPDSLQGAILARIDRLTEDARQALQMAAVIGRRFQVEALRNLAGDQVELEPWLAQLERNDLIRPGKEGSNDTYAFPDTLVQEVAYDSLLVQRRQEFHRRMGLALEDIFSKRLEQECELLAYHFSRSDDKQRAIHYLEMAGHKAQVEFANETAVQDYSDLLSRMGGEEKLWAKRFDILKRRQQLYGLLGQQAAREDNLLLMQAIAGNHDSDAHRADALNGLADLYQWTGRYKEAEEAARQALQLKEALVEPAGQAEALHQIGVVTYYRGDYAEAQPALEQAVTLRQTIQDAEGEAWSAMYLGMIHFVQGNYGEAMQRHEEALQSAQSRQDWFQMGIHLTNAGRVAVRMGEYERALDQFQKSLEMKIRVGDRIGQGFTLFSLGLVYVYRDEYDEAESSFRASLELRRQINDERGISYCLHGLGLVAHGRGQYNQARDNFQQAYEARSRLGLKAETIADLSYLGQAHLGLERPGEALAASQQAIALLEEQKNVEEVQQIYLNHYRVLAAQGDPAATDYLQQACDAMMRQAEQIHDPETRQIFLGKVKVNQEIKMALAKIAE